jgi:hypothetical protein
MRHFRITALTLLLPMAAPAADVVIYGGTSAGIIAAVQTARMGKKPLVIATDSHLGGLTTGGLGWTDIGNKMVIGGLAREFYSLIGDYYAKEEAWNWQNREDYRMPSVLPAKPGGPMWTFEPKVASQVYRDLIKEYQIEIIPNERLDLTKGNGVVVEDGRIKKITMESGRSFEAKMFIDATYEGDLLAVAGVSFTVGRESNELYAETYNGVQVAQATKHQLPRGIDPYVVKGDPNSGLLPGIDPTGPGEEGKGDKRVQAYNFRMCLTDHPENMVLLEKPLDYQELEYELLLRYVESGKYHPPASKFDPMPNRKTDTNNHGGFSTDYIGQNYAYPEADHKTREQIIARHKSYQIGYLWTLQNHPRVPEKLRAFYLRWGLPKDEFAESGHWTPQLYVREARRMIGEVVMNQNHIQEKLVEADSVGMGAYGMDSHNVQRYITKEGDVQNEGDVQVGGFPPYPISYRAILPRRTECRNLLVPVALSASHIAYGSIRMEPVFMVLGQSAATAACLALDQNVDLHDVPYEKLQARLLIDKQVLTLQNAVTSGEISREDLDGIVVDDSKATLQGKWVSSHSTQPFLDAGYQHDDDGRDGKSTVTFTVELPKEAAYEIKLLYPHLPNRARNTPVALMVDGKSVKSFTVDQTKQPDFLGPVTLKGTVEIQITNKGTDGHVVVDGLHIKEASAAP